MKGKTSTITYFYVYFVIQLMYIYINVYLPIYFFNVLKVDKVELAFILIFSYSVLLIRPVIGYYYDTHGDSRRKLGMVIGSFLAVISFALFLINAQALVIFGIFFGINLASCAVLRVSVDKAFILKSDTDKAKAKNATIVQIGSIFGAIFPNIMFFALYSGDIYSSGFWTIFYLSGIGASIPMIVLVCFFKEAIPDQKIVEKTPSIEVSNKRNIVLLCLFAFFVYADRLYEYLMEPWILVRYGEKAFVLYSLVLVVFIGINAIGIVIAGMISPKYDKKKLLIISTVASGIITLFIPLVNLTIFILLMSINQILAGFILINMISCMIDVSETKAFKYHIISTFVILTQIALIPLGILLSVSISTEFIIIIVGILTISSVIPLFFVNLKKD